ncbi:hypothetical protein X801_05740 [Opisthorchis viverrini]|uniref:Uncharacterized protein n=1 Tax=Opisthorchis viverrini TaxID=6198 RepID=A0A1S8WVA7_OPIVI|nr:hypothetical protein X801_05740 [Opisthorchis viverrini]
MQCQFLCSTFEIETVAVVDTYRIPKSPKYMGTGPRPLKLTLLRGDMLNLIQTQWQRHRNLLPRELRISTSMRNNIPTEETKVNEDEAVGDTSKNDQLPTPPGSAQLQPPNLHILLQLSELCERHLPNLIAISETWFQPHLSDSELAIPGMTLLRRDRIFRGGGVAIYHSKQLLCRVNR